MNGLSALAALMGRNPFEAIREAYPGARITSGYRGPDHPLTRKNPSSKHALGSKDNPGAIDLAPILGVSFDAFVETMRAKGLPITGALDEQKNPKPWTTGPNWHLSLNPQAVEQPQQMSDAEKAARAAAFNIKIPGSATEGLNQSIMAGAMLPQNVQAELPQAMAQAQATDANKKKHNGLFPGNDMAAIAGILGDALMAYGGLQPSFGPMMADKSAREREQELALERERIKRLEAAQKPIEHTNSAGDVVRINPVTGEQQVVYADPFGKNQYQVVENPATGAKEIMPTGSHPRPNPKHIQMLLSTGDKQNFDAKFGPGMADYYLRQFGGR